jgi:CO/xanthine dehydrogenase FAD-binding subunit
MPVIISDQQVFTPHDLTEALQFMADHRDEQWRPVAGGTDVMREIYGNSAATKRWINLKLLRDNLAGIRDDGSQIRIGSLTTMTEIRRSSVLQDACPLIRQAATSTGGVQTQNRATVGGQIISASPAGELLPVWLVLDAEIELTSQRAKRFVTYEQFMTARRRTVIQSDELLTAITFRSRPDRSERLLFCKVASRSACTIGKVIMAAIAELDSDGRYRDMNIAFGGMGPMSLRARTAEQQVCGSQPSESLGEQAAKRLTDDLTPIDDYRSTASYRWQVARNLIRAFVAGHLGEQRS